MMTITNMTKSGLQRCARILHAVRSDKRGNVLTEVALIMPIFAMLAMGAFDMGRFAMEYSRLEQAVRAGAQLAMQDVNEVADLNSIEAAVTEAVAESIGADIAALTVSASTDCGCGEPGAITVAVCSTLCDDGNTVLTVLTVSASHVLDPMFSVPGLLETHTVSAEIQLLVQ